MPGPQDPPMRPVGLDDGSVARGAGVGVGLEDEEDLPEPRAR